MHVVFWQSQPDVYSLVDSPINIGDEEKEGINGRMRTDIGREWTNRKERGGIGDGWDYFC